MTTSGTISTTTFNTNKVIDHAYRRCRISAQRVTAEMQDIARDALYLTLSELASTRAPSWCIEKIILPFYQGQPVVTLPVGTVRVLNANYRTLQQVSGSEITDTSTEYSVNLDNNVSTIGIKWAGASVSLEVEVSDDALVWEKIADIDVTAAAGEWTWQDIIPQRYAPYLRITSVSPFLREEIYFGNSPTEIPFGVLNRDSYVNQAQQLFQGRPTTYWFQRDLPQPVMNLWPAPNLAAEYAQLIVWRHRHIMDVGTLTQEIEVPQRWLDAIVNALAARLAMETDSVDMNLIPVLNQMKDASLRTAWDGDNDGSSIFIQPYISPYTK